ncbi:hypothetical protein BgiBS90_031497, partial [Biomphalaria glabrata]
MYLFCFLVKLQSTQSLSGQSHEGHLCMIDCYTVTVQTNTSREKYLFLVTYASDQGRK